MCAWGYMSLWVCMWEYISSVCITVCDSQFCWHLWDILLLPPTPSSTYTNTPHTQTTLIYTHTYHTHTHSHTHHLYRLTNSSLTTLSGHSVLFLWPCLIPCVVSLQKWMNYQLEQQVKLDSLSFRFMILTATGKLPVHEVQKLITLLSL